MRPLYPSERARFCPVCWVPAGLRCRRVRFIDSPGWVPFNTKRPHAGRGAGS